MICESWWPKSSIFSENTVLSPLDLVVSLQIRNISWRSLNECQQRVGSLALAAAIIQSADSKGQLISKCIFGFFNFSQKTNKNNST